MIHDTLRAVLIVAVLAAGCSILVETRQRLTVIELSSRMVAAQPYGQPVYQPVPPPAPGRLRQFGQSAIDLADATLGIFR
jgi:hypothetical protein